MTPLSYYQEQISKGVIVEDQQQLVVMHQLERIYQNILQEYRSRQKLFAFLRHPKLVKGLYLWGGVGVGKTFMMDCFYTSLPFPQKMRMHFHQFMQEVHNALTKHQGEADPLPIIAKEIAKKTLILCFDEFYVSDITDAMLLKKLLSALFTEGVCLVTTSNVAPDNLYKNGLQRGQFIPAIQMIKDRTMVMHITTAEDYRLRHLKEAGVFYTPLDQAAQANMEKSFALLTQGDSILSTPILIHGRPIKVIKRTEDVVWFDFAEICHVPRSQKDYLAIAKQYKTVFISNVRVIGPEEKDLICLFISMVDVFYDARVRLVISAAESVEELYSRGYKILEYTRTHSRLQEMQSVDYFSGEFNHE